MLWRLFGEARPVERLLRVVISGNPLAFNVRLKAGSAGPQLAFFPRLRRADGTNEIQYWTTTQHSQFLPL
jgi:hypothetical protein